MPYQAPTYEQPIMKGNQTSMVWYRFLQNLWQGPAPANESTVAVGASPFAYTAPVRGFVIVKGGTVTAIQFTRSLTTLTGQTAGIFFLNQGDILTVTYSALPSLIFVPT